MTSDQGPEVRELVDSHGVFSILNVLLEDSGDLPEPDGDGSLRVNVTCGKSPKQRLQ